MGNTVNILRPIEWTNTGTSLSVLATQDNTANATTSIFYDQSFNSAGCISIFKNTTGHKINIKEISIALGTAQTEPILLRAVCGLYGQNYDSSSVKAITTNMASLSKTQELIPSEGTTTTPHTLKLTNIVTVKPNSYFYAGILSSHIPDDSYLSIGAIKTSSVVNTIFYTQSADEYSNITWHRSGNANDTSKLSKCHLQIEAIYEIVENDGLTEDVVDVGTDVTLPLSILTSYRYYTNCGIIRPTSTAFEQGTELVELDYTASAAKITLQNNLHAYSTSEVPSVTVTTSLPNRFSIELDKVNNKIFVRQKPNQYYSSTDINVDVILTSTYGTATAESRITLKYTQPKIIDFTVSRNVLRPGESLTYSVKTTKNTGNIIYTISGDTTFIEHDMVNHTITARSRTDDVNKAITIKAKASNGGHTIEQKTIELTHWSVDDIRVQLSCDGQLYKNIDTSSVFDSNNLIIYNNSIEDISLDFKLNSTRLNFGESNSSDKLTTTKTDVGQGSYVTIYPNDYTSSEVKLTASISNDTDISKVITIPIPDNLPDTDLNSNFKLNVKYPVNNIRLPIVPHEDDIYLFTYPIVFTLRNPDGNKITITPSCSYKFESDKEYKLFDKIRIGNGFKNNNISGVEYIRLQQLEPIKLPTDDTTIVYAKITLKVDVDGHPDLATDYMLEFIFDIIRPESIEQNTNFTDTCGIADNILNAGYHLQKAYGYTDNTAQDLLNSDYFGTKDTPKYVGNTEEQKMLVDSISAVKSLSTLVTDLSRSLVIIPSNDIRNRIARGEYIMADDSCDTLANGVVNNFKTSTKFKTHTASPYNEFLKAVQALTGPVEYKPVYYNDVKPIDGDKNKTDYDPLYF